MGRRSRAVCPWCRLVLLVGIVPIVVACCVAVALVECREARS